MSDRSTLELQAQALVELEERAKQNPLYFYEPNTKSRPFHTSLKRIRILSGGNRSGKSETNVAESSAYTMGYRPWVLRELGIAPPSKPWLRPDNLPRDALCLNGLGIRVPVPNTIFMVTGQSMKKGIGETLYPKLQKLLGPCIEKVHMAHSGVPADLLLKNGSRIVFGSAEQGPQSFESTNYTYTSIDEPIPRRCYTGISRGSVDQYAPITMTFTPIGSWAGWIFKDLYAPGVRGGHPDIDVFTMSIYDNKFLSREAIEAFAKDPAISEIEKQSRLYGQFSYLTDRIYSNFDEEHHVVSPFYVPRDWYHGMCVDPHTVKPWAIIYFAISPIGDVYITKEWPVTDFTKIRRDTKTIEDYSLLIRQLDEDLNISCRLIDPNYGPRSDMIRGIPIPSIVSDIARFGLHFNHRLNDDIAYGEAKVRSLLHFNPDKPKDAINRPKLFVFDHCQNVVQSFLLYTAKQRPGSDDEFDDSKREEAFKDFCDCVRYLAVSSVAASPTSLPPELTSSPAAAYTGYGEPPWSQFMGGHQNA